MDLKYNYVVFNPLFSSSHREEDYYYICAKDLEGHDNIIVNHEALQEWPKWIRYAYKLHHHPAMNKWFDLPFKSLWFPFIFKNTFKDDKPICFVCVRYPSSSYLIYLRKHYPNCKIVVLCRDLLKTHEDMYNEYMNAKAIDIWMSYDDQESKKYGFPHFEEFESKIDIPILDNYPLADVFFAGKAKDRLPKLVDVYDNLTSKGVKCLFYVTGVETKDKVEREGIKYLDKQITYYEMLSLSVNSKCILEINQGNAIGYSSRFLEAVMFNKKLITDNLYIKKSQFYNTDYIQCFEKVEDIQAEFVKKEVDVNYNYKDEFSPVHIIELIDRDVLNN